LFSLLLEITDLKNQNWFRKRSW